jgi:hypothetical protein
VGKSLRIFVRAAVTLCLTLSTPSLAAASTCFPFTAEDEYRSSRFVVFAIVRRWRGA